MVPEVDWVKQHYFWSFWTIFCPFNPLTTSKFWNNEKNTWRIIILHMSTIKNNHTMYGSWDMRCDREFFVILDQFLSFYPSNNSKNQNFQEMKKTPKDIFILKKYIKNYDHILQCSWDKACDRCNFHFSFWAIFCPFTPLTSQKIKFLKKWKEQLEISSF